MMIAPITTEQLKDLCRLGQKAETCSFLVHGPDGWGCAKRTSLEMMILSRRANRSMTAMGDNCEGPPTFTPKGP